MSKVIQVPFGKVQQRITIEFDERNQARLRHEKMRSPLSIQMQEVAPIDPVEFAAILSGVMTAQLTQIVAMAQAMKLQMEQKANGGT